MKERVKIIESISFSFKVSIFDNWVFIMFMDINYGFPSASYYFKTNEEAQVFFDNLIMENVIDRFNEKSGKLYKTK